MPLHRSHPIWTVLLLLVPVSVLASPSPDDYRQCHRAAATVLQRCLDAVPGSRHGSRCWDQSRRANEACYREQRSKAHPPR